MRPVLLLFGLPLGPAVSRWPRTSDTKNVDEMIANSTIRAATQSAKKIRQLAGVEGTNNRAWINAVGNLMAQGHGISQALHCLGRGAILPGPGGLNVLQAKSIRDQHANVFSVRSIEPAQ